MSSPPTSNQKNMTRITTPTLLVDKSKCVANIRKMMAKAQEANIRFRPHCKTTASLEIAQWYRDEGVTCITVSSLSMAEYLSTEWKDITVAFPVNILEIETIRRLLSAGVQLNLLVENVEAVDYLEQNLKQHQQSVGIFLKIDVGYGRTGIPAEDVDRIDPVLQRLKSCQQQLQFLGFLTHSGHTYHCHGKNQVQEIHETTKRLMKGLKLKYLQQFPKLQLSFGDTPTCSILDPIPEFQLFDEMRPGNFVFYDLEQAQIGCCEWKDISVAVACPIVAKHPHRRELTLYGGGVHFSKERMLDIQEGITMYGRAVRQCQHKQDSSSSLSWGDVIPGMYVKSLSQEHGVVVVPESEHLDDYQIGDLLFILPVHSCMTADCLKHKGYLTTDGQWIERMKN